MFNTEKPKIIVIVGPTASGKSDLAVEIAKKYNGEVVSADSRQVYKNLNIGSGKITESEMQGIKHYMLDVVSPTEIFSVTQYKQMAENAIKEILDKNKLPILCGGTGFYIDAVINNISMPEVPPNEELREELATKNTDELLQILLTLDKDTANRIDKKNPRRLIRAIEIAKVLGKVPEQEKNPPYKTLIIGIETDTKNLKEKIQNRLEKRIQNGMIEEVSNLQKNGLTWDRLEDFGLEYRYIAEFLQNKLNKEQMITKLTSEIWHYAKRQMTWWKKNKEIIWVKKDSTEKIDQLIKSFL